ncbi:MAG: PDZ domain-containing protein [Verrucomicrobia bacterium]|jgi:serine protease Do|nr:PDZ domain-containing protein [Verrucomicrobiota bacterium]
MAALQICRAVAQNAVLEEFRDTQQRVQLVLDRAISSTVGVGEGGSGVIVSPGGLVLTAAHVSGSPNRPITCRLPDGKRVRARTLGRFDYVDAGMVQLEGEGPWPFSPIGSRKAIDADDWSFALGHPGGFDEERGVVLRVGKVIHARSDFIRTDCKLLRGDSGGPLFNLDGAVVGIHSRIGEPLDDNYHTPIDAFHKMWDTLLAGESIPSPRRGSDRGTLGVGVDAHESGVLLTEIRPDSSAESAGLKVNDIIQSVDGFQIEDTFDFRWAIGKNRPGDWIKIGYLRGGESTVITVELGQTRSRRRRGGF